jgi:TctA family transporter
MDIVLWTQSLPSGEALITNFTTQNKKVRKRKSKFFLGTILCLAALIGFYHSTSCGILIHRIKIGEPGDTIFAEIALASLHPLRPYATRSHIHTGSLVIAPEPPSSG